MSKETINEINNKKKIETNSEQNDSINHLKETNHPMFPENYSNDIISRLQHSYLMVDQTDYYANSVPLGSFCFAISINGFGRTDNQASSRNSSKKQESSC